MREILFRGKIIEPCEYQGQWLEGFYAVENGKPFIAIPKENGLNGFYCDPETVGQYTGLKDKNGTKIFEGDILHVEQRGETGSRICPVYFGMYIDADSNFDGYRCIGFYVKVFDECCTIGVLLNEEFEFEVIDNIYDNPELMGGNTNG